jgi:hypothetical protein
MQISSRIWIFVAFSMRIVHNEEGRIQLLWLKLDTYYVWLCRPDADLGASRGRLIRNLFTLRIFGPAAVVLACYCLSRRDDGIILFSIIFEWSEIFFLVLFFYIVGHFKWTIRSEYLFLFVLWSYPTTALCVIVLSLIHLFFRSFLCIISESIISHVR